MARYPQNYLEIPQLPKAVLAIDTTGHLQDRSKSNRWALTVIILHTSFVFVILMKKKIS